MAFEQLKYSISCKTTSELERDLKIFQNLKRKSENDKTCETLIEKELKIRINEYDTWTTEYYGDLG